jgi:hypothetical protein
MPNWGVSRGRARQQSLPISGLISASNSMPKYVHSQDRLAREAQTGHALAIAAGSAAPAERGRWWCGCPGGRPTPSRLSAARRSPAAAPLLLPASDLVLGAPRGLLTLLGGLLRAPFVGMPPASRRGSGCAGVPPPPRSAACC